MESIGEALIAVVQFIFGHLFWWNMIFAVIIVFFERRQPTSVWAWLLLLYFIPILGFVFYLLLGTDMRKRKMFRVKEVEDKLNEAIRQQEYQLKTKSLDVLNENTSEYADLIMYNLETSGAVLSEDNEVQIFADGEEKFSKLLEDIKAARRFIHIQYYIIRDDLLFAQISEELEKKVKEGVEVRVLFDAMGCRSTKNRFWKGLEEKGIKTAEFFPALLRRLHWRMNYRNHRKIVVIDNEVAYVGGFNVGKEYLGMDEYFGYWRDTHLRMTGSSVLGLQLRFLLDWNYAAKENLLNDSGYLTQDSEEVKGKSNVQIISSGPDNSEKQIRNNYLRLIHKAKKSIYIQTPYFIPDEAVFDSLLIALRSGVDVNVMIPCKPDHLFVYWATFSYIGDLVMAGAKCYTYDKGFLHSKGMIVDDSVLCYGTANMDIRSFALNFEVNAVIYDKDKAEEMVALFEKDLQDCTVITKDIYAGRGLWIRAKEQVCRLLSPLL